MEKTEIYVKSKEDGTMQPSLFYQAKGKEKRPLLVGLHSWSFDRFNQIEYMLPYAEKYGFHLLLPEFRGANLDTNPYCTYACGSQYAKQDIKDAVEYCIREYNVDADNVFLLGGSGGGHMALLMAGFCPELFRAIGAFVGITDLKQWAGENEKYRSHILACCSESEEEMKKRSPMSYVDAIAKSNTKIFHGKYDQSVPVNHSITLFNEMMRRHPDASVYLDIFDGGHDMDMEKAMYWFMSQYNKAKLETVTG